MKSLLLFALFAFFEGETLTYYISKNNGLCKRNIWLKLLFFLIIYFYFSILVKFTITISLLSHQATKIVAKRLA